MVLLKLKKTERKIVFRVPAYNRAGLWGYSLSKAAGKKEKVNVEQRSFPKHV